MTGQQGWGVFLPVGSAISGWNNSGLNIVWVKGSKWNICKKENWNNSILIFPTFYKIFKVETPKTIIGTKTKAKKKSENISNQDFKNMFMRPSEILMSTLHVWAMFMWQRDLRRMA